MIARSSVWKKFGVGSDGTERIGAARHQEAEGVDRIARIGHQHDVARRGDRLRDVGEAFLGAERGDDLGVGIELHAEAALVIGGLRAAQAGNAARGRIAVGARLAQRLLQLLDDMRGRRQIRIAHAEVDDVGARIAGARLGPVHLLEHIGRQTADAVKFFHRLRPSSRLRPACALPMRWLPFPAGRRYPGRLLSRVGLGASRSAPLSAAAGFFFGGVARPFWRPAVTGPSCRSRAACQLLFQLELLFLGHGRGRRAAAACRARPGIGTASPAAPGRRPAAAHVCRQPVDHRPGRAAGQRRWPAPKAANIDRSKARAMLRKACRLRREIDADSMNYSISPLSG